MIVEPDTVLRRASKPIVLSAETAHSAETGKTSLLLEKAVARLRGEGPRYAGIAPGRINIMGGVSDYTGALVIHQPISSHACVAIQETASATIDVTHCRLSEELGPSLSISLSRLESEPGDWVNAQSASRLVSDEQHASLR